MFLSGFLLHVHDERRGREIIDEHTRMWDVLSKKFVGKKDKKKVFPDGGSWGIIYFDVFESNNCYLMFDYIDRRWFMELIDIFELE